MSADTRLVFSSTNASEDDTTSSAVNLHKPASRVEVDVEISSSGGSVTAMVIDLLGANHDNAIANMHIAEQLTLTSAMLTAERGSFIVDNICYAHLAVELSTLTATGTVTCKIRVTPIFSS